MTETTRRSALLAAGALAAAPATAAAQAAGSAGGFRPAPTKDGKSALTPDQALDLLKQGNRDFLADRPFAAPVGNRRRLELATGQAPFAAYVSCSDSRVRRSCCSGAGWGSCSSSVTRATRWTPPPWAPSSSRSACWACRWW
jgi:carbonic anhydrase